MCIVFASIAVFFPLAHCKYVSLYPVHYVQEYSSSKNLLHSKRIIVVRHCCTVDAKGLIKSSLCRLSPTPDSALSPSDGRAVSACTRCVQIARRTCTIQALPDARALRMPPSLSPLPLPSASLPLTHTARRVRVELAFS